MEDLYPDRNGPSTLIKAYAALDDSGVYTCVAMSVAGQARHDIMVTGMIFISN